MAKVIVIVILAGVALATLRNWVVRARRPEDADADDRDPRVGTLVVIAAMVVLLTALFILPRVVDALP